MDLPTIFNFHDNYLNCLCFYICFWILIYCFANEIDLQIVRQYI
jgi:hypothetical protein